MPFDESLEEHRIAGLSLRNGMYHRVRLVAAAFASERCCALGRWIHEEGARRGDTAELQQLKLAHASFHAIALSIAISITQGRLADAAVMLEPDALFESAARMLALAISHFGNAPMTGWSRRPPRTEGNLEVAVTRRSLHDSISRQLIRAVSGKH
jgi:hypothetical protein